MTTGDRGPAGRAERVRSTYAARDWAEGDREPDRERDWDRDAGGGLTRILVVVILLHVAGIAGVLGYRWLHRGDAQPGSEGFRASEAERPPVEELLPESRTNGKAILVPHPTLEGHYRYRVVEGEQLIDVARRFNASVAEVEKLNSWRPDTPLYGGQWLTVPDHRERAGEDLAAGPVPGREKADGSPAPAPVPTPGTGKNAGKSPKASESSKPVASGPGLNPLPEPVSGKPLTEPATEPAKPKAPAPPPPPARDAVEPKVAEPAPEPARAEAPKPQTPAPAGQVYKVNPGDTAYRIALRYGVTWQELLQHNGLNDPKQLQAGQVLKIPPKR